MEDVVQTNTNTPANFPAVFFNEDNLPLTTPGRLGPDGRRYWLVYPIVSGRSEAWRPGESTGIVRAVWTDGSPEEVDVLFLANAPGPNPGEEVSKWQMATYHPAVPSTDKKRSKRK